MELANYRAGELIEIPSSRATASKGISMIDNDQDRWRQLCEQASKEQNPKKLVTLMEEINRLLSAQHDRVEKNTLPPKGRL